MDYRHIERFNRIAVERELSAGAILLWQQLYCMMQRKNNFSDVKICTAVLLGFLDLTRNGFQKARKALVEAGVLGIRYEGEDIYYTLELVNFAHDEKAALSGNNFSAFSTDAKNVVDIAVNSANTVGRHDHMPPLAQRANMEYTDGDTFSVLQSGTNSSGCESSLARSFSPMAPISAKSTPSGDVISNNGYEETMKEFTTVHRDGELYGVLRQWAEMRRENGWTLSLWGLQELLGKLAALAAGDIKTMIATVRQSIARRWKGFHPLRKECKPSGEKLRQEERQREWLEAQQKRNGRTTQKFRKEERDLSFLEI